MTQKSAPPRAWSPRLLGLLGPLPRSSERQVWKSSANASVHVGALSLCREPPSPGEHVAHLFEVGHDRTLEQSGELGHRLGIARTFALIGSVLA